MNFKAWVERKLGTTTERARLEFGGAYVFAVKEKAYPVLIVTRAYSHAIYGIDLARIDRKLRPGVVSEYKEIMDEKEELRRNGLLFNLERQLKRFQASSSSIVSYKPKDIVSQIVSVDIEELEDLARRAI